MARTQLTPFLLVLALAAASGGAVAARAQEGVAPAGAAGLEGQLDLNRATLDELRTLPIPAGVAEKIFEFRTYRSYFTSLFQLLDVDGVTPEILRVLRPLVFITPDFEVLSEDMAEEERRSQDRYYLVQRLLSEEGASEGLVDEYIYQLRDPLNVNRLGFFELMSYQNVSPVDAVAVLKERAMTGKIENMRQMRSATGLSYWGFRNLRDYVKYDDEPTGGRQFSGDYQFRMYNTPYLLDDSDIMNEVFVDGNTDYDENTVAGRLGLAGADPYMTNKLRFSWGDRWKGAVITHRNLGEKDWNETAKFSLTAERFNPVETALGRFHLHRAVAGNYRLAFGQGLIMDSTDFFMPRQTGYGYSIRPVGLRSDVSRSDEYALKGGAVEASLGRVRGTFFYSDDDKDAILNPDGSFNRYFTMRPRLSDEFLDDLVEDFSDVAGFTPDAYQHMRDVMDERLAGANVKFEFLPGTYVGLTGMEMRYENNAYTSPVADRWDPSSNTLFNEGGQSRVEARDAEIGRGYDSRNLGNYRRVWGGEAQTVFSNVSFAGEYGKLETSGESSALDRIFSNGPEAFIANAYVQYENFNFLALYRDYDIGYDNPYNRAFAEDSRFEGTLIDGNPFRMNNPYWSQLALNTPQPKSERGWYFSTRYQFTRQFTLTGLEYDSWRRKADDADLRRLTIRAEYRPVFPVRFRIRHRISSRHEERVDDIRHFTSWDSRIEMLANLSRFDQVRFLFSTSNVEFAPRPRLSAPATGGNTAENVFPSRGLPAKAVQGIVTHNFNDYLSLSFSTEIYDGFLYNFEDNEFIVVDGTGFRNWFLIRSRLSESLAWRFKWTTDHQRPRTFVDIRNFGSLEGLFPDADNAREDRSSYRFQLDYSF